MKRRTLIQFGASATAGLTLAGVPLSMLAAGKADGVINVLVHPEPPGLNLGIQQNLGTQLVGANVFESLLRYDDKINPLPSLASSWLQSKDGLTYTFKLKPAVKWHDGRDFSSADVVFSADVLLRKTHARVRANLAMVESITAPDSLTIVFKLKHPFGPFLSIFEVSSMPILPKHIYEGTDYLTNAANNAPIGTGPFKFKNWVRGSYIELVANADYHVKDQPAVQQLFFHVIPDAASRAAAFESGKIDLVPGGGVEYFDVKRLSQLPGVSVTSAGWEFLAPTSFMWVNNRKAPMDNPKFRQALMYAIDRDAICRVAWQGFAKPATGPFNRNIRFHTEDVRKYAHEPELAKQFLKAASYNGETLRLLPIPYGETWARTAEMIRQNLLQVGIKTQMVATDTAGWNQKLSEWDFDLATTYVYQYGDPALGVARNYTTANIAKGSPFNNVEGYSNPKVDALFEAGVLEIDPNKRASIYADVQKLLVEEVPVAWLFEINFPTLYRTKLKNAISAGLGTNDGFGRTSIS